MKKYNIIYADPPWRYRTWSMERRAVKGEKWGRAVGVTPYDVMNTEDIMTLPVGELADKDCVLFLWATFPTLEDAFRIIKAWGFVYKTVAFTWAKLNPKGVGFHFGLGFWTRANAEICLLATKGHPRRVDNRVAQLVVSPRREHSRKPDEVRDRIVQLMGDLPRIELFARQVPEGWDVWGNEVESDIDLKPEPQIPKGFFREI